MTVSNKKNEINNNTGTADVVQYAKDASDLGSNISTIKHPSKLRRLHRITNEPQAGKALDIRATPRYKLLKNNFSSDYQQLVFENWITVGMEALCLSLFILIGVAVLNMESKLDIFLLECVFLGIRFFTRMKRHADNYRQLFLTITNFVDYIFEECSIFIIIICLLYFVEYFYEAHLAGYRLHFFVNCFTITIGHLIGLSTTCYLQDCFAWLLKKLRIVIHYVLQHCLLFTIFLCVVIKQTD
ncbi:hypothetical protein DPMN_155046 [Dreissena polymorpha]|uniref:Uncharacterized protein n=1 Tax=Dreissena polymorpha TaxID=45954 RepID=A0A9D4J6B0_DREPO|nr:hypothetical protein DPMN_155046 [Dreissena polymorpha]